MSKAIKSGHRPNIRHLEIHITYRCNLRCAHCSNLIEQAPSAETMNVERVKALLDESTRLSWPWEWIVLHGGEPTMHPEFDEICRLLHGYKNGSNPNCRLFLCTNGTGKRVAAKIEVAKSFGLDIQNSDKSSKSEFVESHVPLSYSPEDLGEDYYLGCFQTSKCGIAYTNQGFYECSPAAAAFRVFGYKPVVKELTELTEEKLAAAFALHCKHCGYARLNPQPDPHAPMTKTWQDAVNIYRRDGK